MEFVHMFHERTGHRYPTSSFGVRRRRGGPESRHHHDGDWPWGWQRQDFGHGYYESVDDDNDDDDGRPGGGTSSPLNGHAGPEENPFQNRSSDRWQHFGPNHHHASSPMRDMPEVFSAPGVTTTPAYSVEEPTTPPLTDDAFFPRLFPVPGPPPGNRNPGPRSPPPDRSQRQRRKSRHGGAHTYTSSSPFLNRSPPGPCFDDGAHLPPLTERCETLPSSASSTPPSTRSRRPLSPTPSPRARSPDSFTRHVYRDTDGEDHRHRSPP
ncbi:hypothetical protein MMC22_010353, partial [Lobaria immixta]|nr:hypothetical protein [Lobaria immixta]